VRIRCTNFFLLLLCTSVAHAFTNSRSVFVPRSQDTNTARRLFIIDHDLDIEDTCYTFWAAPGFTRSFRSNKIACSLFGSSCLVFSGSKIENRGSKDILADYFGLPADFKSRVSFKPTITNFFIDCGWIINLDWIHKGMKLQLLAPFVHTRWDLKLCEKVLQKGELFHPAGYMSGGNQRIERNKLVKDVKTAFQGNCTFGDMQDPLEFGKICGKQTETGIAQLRSQLYWIVTEDESYRLNASVFVSAPTGNRPNAEYLFEPVVGAHHHWQLGIGLHGAWDIWSKKLPVENSQSDYRINKIEKVVDPMGDQCRLVFDLNLSHMFRCRQRRSFDFKNKPGSRYALLMNMATPPRDDILRVPEDVAPDNQYTGHLFPAINKTTLKADVSVALQADLLFALSYTHNSWTFDIGYNFWGRTKEKIKCVEAFPSNKFALKGDAQLYGFYSPGEEALSIAVPLNGTQSGGTVYSGQKDANGNTNTDWSNKNVDNPAIAFEADTPGPLLQLTGKDFGDLAILFPGLSLESVSGSDQAVLLTNNDIDVCSAASPRASTSKLFATCSYTLDKRERWDPYVGWGLELEFAHSCRALSQFGAWIRFGASY